MALSGNQVTQLGLRGAAIGARPPFLAKAPTIPPPPEEPPTIWDLAAADVAQLMAAGDPIGPDPLGLIFAEAPEMYGFHDLVHLAGTFQAQWLPAQNIASNREQRPPMASLQAGDAAQISDADTVVIDGGTYTVATRVDGGPGMVTLVLAVV